MRFDLCFKRFLTKHKQNASQTLVISGPTHQAGHTLDLVICCDQVHVDLKVGEVLKYYPSLVMYRLLSGKF